STSVGSVPTAILGPANHRSLDVRSPEAVLSVRVVCLLVALSCLAGSAKAEELAPGSTYSPAIPTLKQVLGYEPGAEITTPEGIAIYLKALHDAAPDRTRLVEYARTWEGRPLYLFIIASPERIASLDQLT